MGGSSLKMFLIWCLNLKLGTLLTPKCRWTEEASELTGRTDGNKRVVFPDRGVIDGLKQCGDSLGRRAVSASSGFSVKEAGCF